MTQDEIIEMATEIWNTGSSFPIPSSDDILHFAKLVAERALADPMREVQRLGQEIEQKPVAWQWLGSAHFRKKLPKNADVTAWNPLYSAPQRTEPVACERCKQLEEHAYDLVGKLRVANIKLSMNKEQNA